MSLYAEYLPKLGRLSIVAHLPTPSTQATQARISNPGGDGAARLAVTHDGVTSELTLPLGPTTTLRHDSSLGATPPGLDKLSWGFLLQPRRPGSDSGGISGLGRDAGVVVVPWSAADLPPGVAVVCRGCEAVVIEKDRLRVWKDLPSENWAEMMEFWHCHKPATTTTTATNKEDDNKASEEELAARGYGANSAIVAQPGVGFVDLTTMLFHPDDSRCVVKPTDDNNDEESGKPQSLRKSAATASCPGCGTQLGHLDTRKGGVSLFKWKLNLLPPPAAEPNKAPPRPPTLSQCLAAALMANQARSGSAKVVLRGESEEETITVWVLNPHVNFSCPDKPPTTAMKLLYREQATNEEEDELDLPDEAIRGIRLALREGSGYLPRDERVKTFGRQQDAWTVTLLERQEP